MTPRRSLRLSIAAFLLFAFFISSLWPPATRAQRLTAPQRRPKLVLLIAVDQFRYDYLERFGDLFGPNGFKRLQRDGASWTQSNYDHTPTYTAPGHATMMTGAYPSESGIIANEWLDRPSGKRITSVTDDSVKILGGDPNEAGVSPRRLLSSTVGDELRLVTNDRSKVLGISVKDRSAILPAGRHANAAYWFSWTTGNMVSSTYYFNQLPAWVTNFNNTRPADKYFGAKWDRLIAADEYVKRAGPDSPPWETVASSTGDTNAFPHTITGGAKTPGRDFYAALDYTPFSNDLLVSFTEQAITNEQLGQDEDTDVLTVSFSANDYVGHRYGPYSQEAMDITLRVDQQIATLLDFVAARVGLSNTLIVFTADHGVAPIPEHAAALGMGGARINTNDVLAAIHTAIRARYNPQGKSPDPTADYLLKDPISQRDWSLNGNIYLNYDALKRDGINTDEISQVIAAAALTVPGIARCFTRAQLLRGATSIDDPVERRVTHGFFPARSGDVVIVAEPYKYLGDTITATHGSPYTYDTHVPTILMGPGIVPGRYLEPASPADIAPTLSALLHITAPSSVTGRILLEAIRK
ncbi:MAG TPA: alkaline phosphatase family protein [Pyrinomonadaceae bacterium]|nr:alkaline phosphatase family protein [Pyrinomonadaceae bacterium]